MNDSIPITPLFRAYTDLHFKGAGKRGEKVYAQRLSKAKRLLKDPQALVDMFRDSLAETENYFGQHDYSDQDFYPKGRPFKKPPGIESTDALGHYLHSRREKPRQRKKPWPVLGDESLSFYYLDRELVSTRALGARLKGGASTASGPRLDLLLANVTSRLPILGEVKLTNHGAPDKDPFFALIQALASATYLLPPTQLSRLRRSMHDPEGRLTPKAKQLNLYLLIGEPPERSPIWFELRDYAERLAALIAPRISDRIHTIAGLELAWFKGRPEATQLRITKRFSHMGSQ